jgi:hydrogenase nickel incorporation protein HypA/HybF
MHELPVTQGILSIVLEQARTAQADKISRIYLTIGELSGIVPEYIRLQFDMLSKDTAADGAEIVIKQPVVELHCRNCDNVFTPEGKDWTCPKCAKEEIDITAGRECFVESMEVV